MIATWDEVTNATSYKIALYRNDILVVEKDVDANGKEIKASVKSTNTVSYDFSQYFTSKGEYRFTVVAQADGYISSDISGEENDLSNNEDNIVVYPGNPSNPEDPETSVQPEEPSESENPETPVQPEEPSESEEPETPDQPEVPIQSENTSDDYDKVENKDTEVNKEDSPKTGDAISTVKVPLLSSIFILIGCILLRRKRK